MPAGFQAVNDSGVLQIDGSYKNLALLRSGTASISPDTPPPGRNTTNAVINYNPSAGELIAISCNTTNSFAPWWTSDTQMGFRVLGSGSGPLNYWVFGNPQGSSNVGLQVFDSSGALAFDSSWKPLRVRDFIMGNDQRSYSSAREYALIFLAQYYEQTGSVNYLGGNVFIATYQAFMTMCVGSTAGGDVNIENQQVINQVIEGESPPEPPQPAQTSNGVTPQVMVVDVTGY